MDVLFSKNQDNIANAIQETLDKYLSIKENFLGLKWDVNKYFWSKNLLLINR